MRQRHFILIMVMIPLLIVLAATTSAQTIPPSATPVDSNAMIEWPPPVYVLRGEIDIRGSANLPNMSSYFVEFRPLNADLSAPPDDAPWFPATLPSLTPVVDGILGTWNTATAPEGVYELRLTINISGGDPVFFTVSPLRIENNPPPWVQIPGTPPTLAPTATFVPDTRPTLRPTPTAVSSQPMVTARLDANVRSGDDLIYDRIGYLRAGESAPIVGISSFNSGWYLIQMSDGRRGWIAPSVVSVQGDLSGLPIINPPPLPTPVATATPILPTITPSPITSANLFVNGFELVPPQPVCGAAFQIRANVINNGTAPTSASGMISAQDVHSASGTAAGSTNGGFPVMNPGDNFVVVMNLTVNTYYAELHQITLKLDSNGEVPETNENDNITTLTYTLAQGSCP